MGAEYLFYMKSIETHARAFLALIILGIGTVRGDDPPRQETGSLQVANPLVRLKTIQKRLKTRPLQTELEPSRNICCD